MFNKTERGLSVEGKIFRNQTLDQQVYSLIREAIAKGKYAQGDRLVEATIAEELSISRTPVREAIRKLETEGLVVRGSSGVTVNIPCRADIAETYAVRAHMEGLAACIAAQAADEDDLNALRKILDQEKKADSKNIHELISIDSMFHMLVVKISKNNRLLRMFEQFNVQTPENDRLVIYSDWDEYITQHEEIYKAIENRSCFLAEELAKKHIIEKGYRIYENLTKLRDGDIKQTPTKTYIKGAYKMFFGKL